MIRGVPSNPADGNFVLVRGGPAHAVLAIHRFEASAFRARRRCGRSRGFRADCRVGANPGGHASGHLHEGHRAHPAAQLPELPPARLGRADVASHLRGGAPVRVGHQAPHVDPQQAGHDAAVVHREGHRHPAVQERHLAQRRGSGEDRTLGGQRRAARQPGRHAEAARVRRRRGLDHRHARSRRLDAPGQPEGRDARLVGQRRRSPIRASPKIATSRRSRSRK